MAVLRPKNNYSTDFEDTGLTIDDVISQVQKTPDQIAIEAGFPNASLYSIFNGNIDSYNSAKTLADNALKMGVGSMPKDLSYDVNADGKVNSLDAMMISKGTSLVKPTTASDVVQTIAQPIAQTATQTATTSEPTPTQSKTDVIDALTKQILGQNTTANWQGGVDAQTAAKDMAKIMAGIGITDINQFGKVTQTGLQEDVRPDGRGGFVNLKGVKVDPALVTPLEMDGNIVGYSASTGTQETYGNKLTGQVVPNTYSERQTGNAFGGTFEGKGNTGYRVEFDASGKPFFYTTGSTSRDDIGVFAPIIAAALTPIIGPAAASLLGPTASTLATNALTGAMVGGSTAAITGDSIAKGALLGGAGGALSDVVKPYLPSLPTPEVPIDFVGGTTEQINDALKNQLVNDLKAAGVTNVSEFITNIGGNASSFVPSGVSPVVQTPIDTVKVTAPVATKTVEQVIASIMPEVVVKSQAPKEQSQQIPTIVAPSATETIPQITTIGQKPSTITNQTEPAPVIVAPPITGTTPPKTYTTAEIIDMIRLGVFGASVLGAANQETGPTGFPIVPVPEDWKSPTYAKDLPSVAPTQLPPIDFGNRNLLIGTQWEKFLDPNYGKVPAPVQFNQPSDMSYDRLMSILGTSRDVLPSQVLSINDVISGIQNQYGQTPTGSMG